MNLSELPDPPFTAYTTVGWDVVKIEVDRIVSALGDVETQDGNIRVNKAHLYATFEDARAPLLNRARNEYKIALRRLARVSALTEEDS